MSEGHEVANALRAVFIAPNTVRPDRPGTNLATAACDVAGALARIATALERIADAIAEDDTSKQPGLPLEEHLRRMEAADHE